MLAYPCWDGMRGVWEVKALDVGGLIDDVGLLMLGVLSPSSWASHSCLPSLRMYPFCYWIPVWLTRFRLICRESPTFVCGEIACMAGLPRYYSSPKVEEVLSKIC